MTRTEALARIRDNYTVGVRRLAARGMQRLGQSRVTPNALTATGVTLCIVGSVLVYFEYRNEYLFYWLGGAVFVIGSILDILDGALARSSGKGTPFGAFLDSTTDRVGEGFMLGSIGLIFYRHGNEVALAFAMAAIAGSFLVSYARAKAEALGSARRRRTRVAHRTSRRDLGRPRARALGRAPLGDLHPGGDRMDHRRPADPARPPPASPALIALFCYQLALNGER